MSTGKRACAPVVDTAGIVGARPRVTAAFDHATGEFRTVRRKSITHG